MGKAASAFVFSLTVLILPGAAGAQARPDTPTAETPLAQTAYGRLSPGNRVIAKCLYEAEIGIAGTTRPATATTTAPWSLEVISMARASGLAWREIFRLMKNEGLLAEQNLGDVVSRYTPPPPDIKPAPDTKPAMVTKPAPARRLKAPDDLALADGRGK